VLRYQLETNFESHTNLQKRSLQCERVPHAEPEIVSFPHNLCPRY
jgi:hypothetical protein